MDLKASPGRCQEASHLSHDAYIPCNAPAVSVVRGRDGADYRMCSPCAAHNISNRGAVLVGPFVPEEDDGAITHYDSASQGRIAIKEMPYPHLKRTIDKVARDNGGGPSRLLDALRAELAARPDADLTAPAVPGSLKPAPPKAGPPAEQVRSAGGAPVSRRLEPAAPGDNKAPPDANPLRERLEEEHRALLDAIADHEMDVGKLPKEVKSDEDVAAITAWGVKAKALDKEAERLRIETKEPYLEGCRTVDGFFTDLKAGIKNRWAAIEQRSTSFLLAKRAREQAQRAAAENEARRLADEQRETARREQVAADDARRQAQAAEEELRRRAAATAGPTLSAEEDPELTAAADRLRHAREQERLSNDAAEQAAKDARKLDKTADRHEKALTDGRTLERTVGGGGSAKVKMIWVPRIDDREAVRLSLGPLAAFIPGAQVEAAISRAAAADPRPTIPGVSFHEEPVTRTN